MAAAGQILAKLLGVAGTLLIIAGIVGWAPLVWDAFNADTTSGILGSKLPSGTPMGLVYAGTILAGVILKAVGSAVTTTAGTASATTGVVTLVVVSTVLALGGFIALHQALGGASISALAPSFPASCGPAISVEPLQAQAGQSLAVSGHCYPAHARVAPYVDGQQVGSGGIADASGNVSIRFGLTSGSQRAFPGMHTVEVRVVHGAGRSSSRFRVIEP